MPKSTAESKFSTLFDRNWASQTSALRTKADCTRTYDPAYSWDGKTENQTKFVKLGSTVVPSQSAKPIAISSDGAIIALEKYSKDISALSVHQEPTAFVKMPLTNLQSELGMARDLSGQIPLQSSCGGSTVVIENVSGFENMRLKKASYEIATVPGFILAAGPQADKCLLTPSQRREFLEFEKKRLAADRAIKEAKGERSKVRSQLKGHLFHRGALMLDSCSNEDSDIYGSTARQHSEEMDQREQKYLERKTHLAFRTSSITVNGNILVPESVSPRVSTNRDYQSKGGVNHSYSFDETYNRIFERRTGNPPAVVRTQNIRNNDLGGRQYNIVNHTVVSDWPSRDVDRRADSRMLHPSQTSLEGPRNLQGTLLRKDVYGSESRVF